MLILEYTNNLILLEEARRKSYKERRTIRGTSARPKSSKRRGNRKMKSLYKPFKLSPLKKRKRIIRRRKF